MRLLILLVAAPMALAQLNPCTFSRDSGDSSCGTPGQKFFFDSRTKHCQPFSYKGCNGNGNRFDTREKCASSCANATNAAPATSDGHGGGGNRAICPAGNVAANTREGPIKCDACPKGYTCQNGLCCGTPEHTCSLGYDAGRFPLVGSHVPMYFYSKQYNNCMLFTYYGSEGNANTFPDYNKCRQMCASKN